MLMFPSYVWRKEHTSFLHEKLIPSVKHCGGSVMVWPCFAESGPGRLAIIDGTMNSELYQQIVKENVKTSVRELFESQDKAGHGAR